MTDNISGNSPRELEQGVTLSPRFNADGLISAVAQEAGSGEILMLAHMNNDALQQTLETGQAHFWSRSRKKLWLKGETSGNILFVEEVRIDCDQDAIVLIVRMAGDSACHTGEKSCFYRSVRMSNGNPTLCRIEKTDVC